MVLATLATRWLHPWITIRKHFARLPSYIETEPVKFPCISKLKKNLSREFSARIWAHSQTRAAKKYRVVFARIVSVSSSPPLPTPLDDGRPAEQLKAEVTYLVIHLIRRRTALRGYLTACSQTRPRPSQAPLQRLHRHLQPSSVIKA